MHIHYVVSPTENKDSFDKPGKTKEMFARGDKISLKGSNLLCVAWIAELFGRAACGPSDDFVKFLLKEVC